MIARALAVAAGLFVVASQAWGQPVIDVGTWVLQPDTPNQPIPIRVEGNFPIEGVNFYAQIGTGGVGTLDDGNAPVIENIDLLTGTIFEPNNTGVWDLDNFDDLDGDGEWDEGVEPIGVWKQNGVSPGVDLLSGFEGVETSTDPNIGPVNSPGLLATIYVSTEGLTTPGASWPLVLSDTPNGPTDFGLQMADITDGRIVIAGEATIPEPSTFVLAGLGLIGMLAFRRLRSRRG